jgi:coenzyme PQQ precursor peptide PqqA
VDSVFTENLSHIARTPFGMELAFNSPDRRSTAVLRQTIKETAMQWTTPAYTDLRFGFEITMYIANR